MLYAHMTTEALNDIVQQPLGNSDIELAREILKQRNEAMK